VPGLGAAARAALMDAPDPVQPWQPMKEVFHLD